MLSLLQMHLVSFKRYSLLVLIYNLIVILWGVFLRASKSGDGCGQHWLTCHGEIIPSAPELKTIIEFSHRITSALAFFAVLILLIWAFRKYERAHPIRKTAVGAFIFIITEALIGAGLVLTGNTSENLTDTRPLWMSAHLINTMILLAFLTLNTWFAYGGKQLNLRAHPKQILMFSIACFGIIIVSITGSISALSNLIFPSKSLIEGLIKDFSPDSHLILRLRILHPFSSLILSFYLLFLASWLKRTIDSPSIQYWSKILSSLVAIQLLSGILTLLTLSPILMQVIHLLIADLIWISLILLIANFFAEIDSSKTPQTSINLHVIENVKAKQLG